MWALAAMSAVALAAGALVLRYMRRPRVLDLTISALRFLPALSPARKDRTRWNLAAPLLSPLFWLRLAILLLLLAVPVLDSLALTGGVQARLGLRIVLDASPSMAMGQPSRLELADELMGELVQRTTEMEGCVAAVSVPAAIAPGSPPDGVSLQDLAAVITPQDSEIASTCVITHVAVISDLPRPITQYLGPADGPAILWFQVGEPVGNTMLRGAEMIQTAAPGRAAVLAISIEEFGTPAGARDLVLTDPQGTVLAPRHAVDLSVPGAKQVEFVIDEPGTYLATLADPGGLAMDDRLRITIASLASLPVWVSDAVDDPAVRAIAARLGSPPPQADTSALLVAPYSGPQSVADSGIYIAPGQAEAPVRLDFFDETSPLLALIDIDLLEAMQPLGISDLPAGFRRIATGNGATSNWVAIRDGDNPAVILPARPPAGGSAGADQVDIAWRVLFVNAFTLLAQGRDRALESGYLDAAGNVLNKVIYESNTAQARGSSDQVGDLQPVSRTMARTVPLWPWLLLAALVLLCIERAVGLQTRWQT